MTPEELAMIALLVRREAQLVAADVHVTQAGYLSKRIQERGAYMSATTREQLNAQAFACQAVAKRMLEAAGPEPSINFP